jgi:hypothetical protein
MAFGSEVDNGVTSSHGGIYDFHIGNVTMNESDVIRQFVQIGHIAAVGKQVEYANRPAWMVFCDRTDVARSDEPSSASDKDGCGVIHVLHAIL